MSRIYDTIQLENQWELEHLGHMEGQWEESHNQQNIKKPVHVRGNASKLITHFREGLK